MNTASFAKVPTFAEFMKEVRELEDRANRFDVEAYDLELDEGGALELSAKALSGQVRALRGGPPR